ncbi:hypothetical protein KC19_10G040600 [Ceratodon purpureus]|uniref:Uncharacterized protein n=1 Tax=Ceratodon purpureus TaxID=3225 RepID=A0A8T0GGN3_CERPU|nr:hypothetical protein KC19_10G040600 [Ceratodon purpureus]
MWNIDLMSTSAFLPTTLSVYSQTQMQALTDNSTRRTLIQPQSSNILQPKDSQTLDTKKKLPNKLARESSPQSSMTPLNCPTSSIELQQRPPHPFPNPPPAHERTPHRANPQNTYLSHLQHPQRARILIRLAATDLHSPASRAAPL